MEALKFDEKKKQMLTNLISTLLSNLTKKKENVSGVQDFKIDGVLAGDQESFALVLNGNEAIISYASQYAKRKLTRLSGELVGTSFLDLLDPKDLYRFYKRYRSFLRKIQEEMIQVAHLTGDDVNNDETYTMMRTPGSCKCKSLRFKMDLLKMYRTKRSQVPVQYEGSSGSNRSCLVYLQAIRVQ